MVIWNAAEMEVKPGQRVVVTNLRVKKSTNGDLEIHGDNGSTVRIAGEKSPVVQALSKVNQVKNPRQKYSVEVMALSSPSVHEVLLKEGGSVQKAELIFGDDTGEITVVGWRTLVTSLMEVAVGEKVRITDATLQTSRMGTLTLELEDGSRIEKVTG
jgi:hypothetical protein